MAQFNPESIKKYRLLLWPLAFFYRLLIFWRNIYYNIGFFVSRKLPCKVISVGNLSVGGTGKTPFVLFLAKQLREKGLKVSVLSRGYKRKSTGTVVVSDGYKIKSNWQIAGDEPYMLAQKLDGIPVVVDERRYRGGQYIINKFQPDVILLDDAFQHRQIYRDVDIVLINSSNYRPKLLPFGLLREPVKNVKRAHAVFFTKANLTPPNENLFTKVSSFCPSTFQSNLIAGKSLLDPNGKTQLANEIHGGVVAVSGIGDPDSFEVILKDAGLDYVHHFRHDDHTDYSTTDLEVIREVFLSAEAEAIITTEKDLAKLGPLKDLPLFALPVNVSINPEDEEQLLEILLRL